MRAGLEGLGAHGGAQPTLEEPREYLLEDGTRWLRTGYCSHCGECCDAAPCPLRDKVKQRCSIYGSETYRGFGCHDYPHPTNQPLYPSCTYEFERVG